VSARGSVLGVVVLVAWLIVGPSGPADAAPRAWKVAAGASFSASESFLSGVSCVSPTFCVAVGSRSSGRKPVALAESWNGSTWNLMPVGSLSGELLGVSCVSTRFCVAVGVAGTTSTIRPVIEVWRGSQWASTGTLSGGGVLGRVSCASPSFCVAVGTVGQPTNPTSSSPQVDVWNGKSWSITPTPKTGKPITGLSSVSCPMASFCAAVGDSGVAKPRNLAITALAESWNGRRWALDATPKATSPLSILSGVECSSALSCVAVGEGIGPLFEGWNGAAWKTLQGPRQQNANYADVSCAPGGACAAVGTIGGAVIIGGVAPMPYQVSCTTGGGAKPPCIRTAIAESQGGGSWSVVASPVVPGSDSVLNSVSCTSNIKQTLCTAVGLTTNRSLTTENSLIEMSG